MASLFPRAALRRQQLPVALSQRLSDVITTSRHHHNRSMPRAVIAGARLLSSSSPPTCRASPSPTTASFASRAASSHLPGRRFYSNGNSSNNNSNNSSSGNSSPPPPPPPPPPAPKPSNIKFWPFLIVLALGSGGYVLLVNQRKNVMTEKKQPPQVPGGEVDLRPNFAPDDVAVIFVLGGPGAGKGTQCARLVQEYGFAHLSAGDLLRAEQDRPGSQFGQLIRDCIRDGAIVPLEVTVKLLENAMADEIRKHPGQKPRKFLIDGFPRKMDQAVAFEEAVCPAKLVLFYDCPEAELERRLLERGKTSGRADDNAASIRKRFRTFVKTSMPVVDSYEKEGRVLRIDATPGPDAVFRDTQKKLGERVAL